MQPSQHIDSAEFPQSHDETTSLYPLSLSYRRDGTRGTQQPDIRTIAVLSNNVPRVEARNLTTGASLFG
jgi:hypothetical protein